MIVKHDVSFQEINTVGGSKPVLIADLQGKLKLAKWRLQSDGYEVFYVRDIAEAELTIREQGINVVLVSVEKERDLDALRGLRSVRGNLEILAAAGDRTHRLINGISKSRSGNTLNRPINYPKLSLAVKEIFAGVTEQNCNKRNAIRFNKKVTIPLDLHFNYKAVMNQIKTGIMLLDAGGRIRFANKAMVSLLGVPEVLGKRFDQIIADNTTPFHLAVVNILRETFRECRVIRNNEIVIAQEASEPLPYEAETHPILDPKGEFIGAFLIIEDVTKPRKMEKAMVQFEKLAMIGQLAAGVTHEIKNPLTSVRGFVQLLQDEFKGTPKVDYINIIIAEIDRVNNIINEFLKMTKPIPPKRKPTHLKLLFDDLNLLVESEAFLKNIELTGDLPAELPKLLIDAEQIKQVLINVIRNSFDAMTEGGILSIKAYNIPDEKRVCLELKDTGTGMDEETLKKVFVPFFTTKDTGTGLGLAVSLEIMERHGGRIDVTSQIGVGTTTCLYFPY